MSLIKFPTQINPARVTISLLRVDETIASPLTNVQQIISRGNPVWRWTYEYVDLTDSERDIVQAFLIGCRGSVNNFKATDPGNYDISGSSSDWLDVFSGHGDFQNQTQVDSFSQNTNLDYDLISNGLKITRKNNLGRSVLERNNDLYEAGRTYVARVKGFVKSNMNLTHYVGSDASTPYNIIFGPSLVQSTDVISAPFFTDITTVGYTGIFINADSGAKAGDDFDIVNYRISQCALVSNSENLITRSNEFDHADWTITAAIVESGFDSDPTGGSNSWKIFSSNSTSNMSAFNQYTKNMSEGLFTYGIYARGNEWDHINLYLGDQAGNFVRAWFNLTNGTVGVVTAGGVGARGFGTIKNLGSDWYRCIMTGLVSSLNEISATTYIAPDSSTLTVTGNGTVGLEIFGGQLREHPYIGHYVPTVAAAVVGTGWQTGSKLYVAGFDDDAIALRTGQRFEIINQYHNNASDTLERSEFKRLTSDLVIHKEGWGVMEFDPPIRNAPKHFRSVNSFSHLGEIMHNAILFDRPELKARLVAGTIRYTDKPLKAMDITFDVIEDMT